jgi:diguanylate cyclase (GGDEF)-like protein/PAS domain S-box-containing protein
MHFTRSIPQDVILGLAYFCAAAMTISLTRFDGGVAFLWIASALLIAVLMARPRRLWGGAFLCCGIASVLATGLLGFGWGLALPFVGANLIEAYVAALLFRRYRHSRSSFGSIPWLVHFVLCVGVAAPAASGLIAAVAVATVGFPVLQTFIHFFIGHALGNITFIPMINLLVGGRSRVVWPIDREKMAEAGILLTFVALATLMVFAQSTLPLLFLPMLPIILAIFRLGQVGAALSIAILALVGGGMTLAGLGPIQLVSGSLGGKMHFFQFYLAATVLTVLPTAADLRNRARLLRELRISEARYRLLADHSSDIMLHMEADGRVRYVSPSIRRLLGFEPEEVAGLSAMWVVSPIDREAVRKAHEATVKAHGLTNSYEHRLLTRTGEVRWFEAHSRAVVDEQGDLDGVLSIIRDISARKAREARLTEAAHTDPLTGLPNRRALKAAAPGRMVSRIGGPATCIALIDIDHFKRINDDHGHDVGDEMLCSLARIARRIMRKHDLVARIGGEEFVLLLPGTSIGDALAICDRLRHEVSIAVTNTSAGPVKMTISGGVALLGPEGMDAALREADEALYRAKAAGRDRMALAA